MFVFASPVQVYILLVGKKNKDGLKKNEYMKYHGSTKRE